MAQVACERRVEVGRRPVEMEAHRLQSVQASRSIRKGGKQRRGSRRRTLHEDGLSIPKACQGFLDVNDPHGASLEEGTHAAMLPMVVRDWAKRQ